ncbi:hypothetical protein OH76DRAFT_703011 [Lentinus brumalis]|uniref:Uncharacterized protein n=1 Tax=Lentinus brumalis TaxID=2498619 RepID=A0A371D5R2_9APHY|nr:hypothetical protein OH76DRAFT_703011 [Polyporus brumalis]
MSRAQNIFLPPLLHTAALTTCAHHTRRPYTVQNTSSHALLVPIGPRKHLHPAVPTPSSSHALLVYTGPRKHPKSARTRTSAAARTHAPRVPATSLLVYCTTQIYLSRDTS